MHDATRCFLFLHCRIVIYVCINCNTGKDNNLQCNLFDSIQFQNVDNFCLSYLLLFLLPLVCAFNVVSQYPSDKLLWLECDWFTSMCMDYYLGYIQCTIIQCLFTSRFDLTLVVYMWHSCHFSTCDTRVTLVHCLLSCTHMHYAHVVLSSI